MSLQRKKQCTLSESGAQWSPSAAQSHQSLDIYDGGALCKGVRCFAQWSKKVPVWAHLE